MSYATRRAGCCWSFEGAVCEASVALRYQPSSCAELKCQRGEKAVSQAFISRETERCYGAGGETSYQGVKR
jgi:hypothetical protein